jgi:hypothetical protein
MMAQATEENKVGLIKRDCGSALFRQVQEREHLEKTNLSLKTFCFL